MINEKLLKFKINFNNLTPGDKANKILLRKIGG
jgi:hypothetical protein